MLLVVHVAIVDVFGVRINWCVLGCACCNHGCVCLVRVAVRMGSNYGVHISSYVVTYFGADDRNASV